jgi:cyclomaltodextrinase
VFRVLARCIGYVLAFVAIPALAAGAGLIDFDTDGGDAWTFEHAVRGKLVHQACDAVVVRAPAGTTQAVLDGDRFYAVVHLWNGDNDLRAECLKHGKLRETSQTQHWTVRLRDTPRASVRLRVEQGAVQLDGGHSEVAPGKPAPLVRYEWEVAQVHPAPLPAGTGKHIEVTTPATDGNYRVTLRVTDAMGRSDTSTAAFRVSHGQPVETDVEHEHPAWLDGAILYGLPLPLLTPFGFEGARARVDEISALGATAVWLSPVTEAPTGDFGYAVTDPLRIRTAFGTEAQFRALIDAAHAHGLKVLLDIVSNHLASGHAYYGDSERRGVRSAYYDWFERNAAGKVVHYFDWNQLENLDYDNPEVRGYITATLTHWIRDYHVDGFRLDAAWAVRERAPEFWPELRRELKRIDPDVVLLAEASARDPYYAARGFDAVYDWSTQLGEWAWQGVFGAPDALPDLARLRQALANSEAVGDGDRAGARGIKVLHFLNNNDTGARFLTQHGLEQTRDAAALMLTLTGLPLIYAGDEVGAAYEPYGGGPPISWFDRYGLEPFYAQLIKLRESTPALRTGRLQLLGTDYDESVLAFLRQPDPPDRPVLVAINFSAGPVEVRVPGNPALPRVRLAPHEFQVIPR